MNSGISMDERTADRREKPPGRLIMVWVWAAAPAVNTESNMPWHCSNSKNKKYKLQER